MVKIVLNDEQAELLSRAREPVNFVDRSGRMLGKLTPFRSGGEESAANLDADVAMALQRMENAKSGGIFYTTKEVLDHLQSLEPS